MGQMIKLTYVGAFIVPEVENFQRESVEDEFYEKFYEGQFRTAYQGLENIDVLIPCSNDYALKDQENYDDEFIIHDFSELKELENKLSVDYSHTIEQLEEMFPDGKFTVKSGVVAYWDEIA